MSFAAGAANCGVYGERRLLWGIKKVNEGRHTGRGVVVRLPPSVPRVPADAPVFHARVRLDQIEDGMVLLRWALGLLDLLAYMLTRCADEQV